MDYEQAFGEVRSLCAEHEYVEARMLVDRASVSREQGQVLLKYVSDQARCATKPYQEARDLNDLKGRVFDRVYVIECDGEREGVAFEADGCRIVLGHVQDCCEQVFLEDVVGDLEDLQGAEIVSCEEFIQTGENDYMHMTYTFYKFRTSKGDVTLRFLGESNGYYSESVDLIIEQGEQK